MQGSLETMTCAVTIAGSDSGGGAGIQADLKTFAALGVHGTSALTCVTAQNPRAVLGVQAVRAEMVRQQLEAITHELRPSAAKTGMLFSAGIIREVARFFGEMGPVPVVVDPVMVASSGATLLQASAITALREHLLPMATLATPNLDEARLLTDCLIQTVDDLRTAARRFHARYGCAVLLKGGHLAGDTAEDVFWDGRREILLRAARIPVVSTHGTGCTYSAAIAACLALGRSLPDSVRRAKIYVTRAIARSRQVRDHVVLEHF
jgi:hydroxymethylpyrimidine/phosphomethylpyrimidine kinase